MTDKRGKTARSAASDSASGRADRWKARVRTSWWRWLLGLPVIAMGTAIPFGPINGEEHTVTATPNPWEPWMIAFIGMMVAAAGTAIAGWRRLTVLLGCSPGALVVAYGLYAVTEPRGARVADAQSQTTGLLATGHRRGHAHPGRDLRRPGPPAAGFLGGAAASGIPAAPGPGLSEPGRSRPGFRRAKGRGPARRQDGKPGPHYKHRSPQRRRSQRKDAVGHCRRAGELRSPRVGDRK